MAQLASPGSRCPSRPPVTASSAGLASKPSALGVAQAARLPALIFAQMLPATLLAPAIRPMFAAHHGGDERAMHAFMAINMLGGAIAAPVLGRYVDRLSRPRRAVALLAILDAVLLLAIASSRSTPLVLGLRLLEGGAHIGAATLLMAEAAALARRSGSGRTMGLAGGALMMAVALGSALGGLVLAIDVRAPFWAGAALAVGVATVAARGAGSRVERGSSDSSAGGLYRLVRREPSLLVPITSAFVGRFTVGCIVVTFSLFAHNAHGLSDRAVGGLFTLLTLPFALATYPAGRLTDRVPRSAVLAVGAAAYALALVAIPVAPTAWLPALMLTMGLASAMIFAPTLCYSATLAGAEERGRAMSLVNAASCAGMLIGPAAAGITSAIFKSAGDPVGGYRAVFVLAGASIALWLAATGPWLASAWRGERSRARAAPHA